jgi:hypothetical protein
MLSLSLDAKCPRDNEAWAAVAASMPDGRTVDECRLQADRVLGWSMKLDAIDERTQQNILNRSNVSDCRKCTACS